MLERLSMRIRMELAPPNGKSIAAIKRGVLERHRENPAWAKTMTGLLSVREDLVLRDEDLVSVDVAERMVGTLEQRPLPRFSFCSVLWEERPCGLLIEKDDLLGGGLIYVVTLFPDANDLTTVCRAELRVARSQPEPFFALLILDGWRRFSRSDFMQVPLLSFMLRCVATVHSSRFKRLPISTIDCADVSAFPTPRENEFLVELCARAYQGEVPCTRAIVPMDLIVPDDIDHALSYPLIELKRLQGFHVDRGEATTELLLYEADGRFVMGDDYSGYLTYKALLFKRVPAVIMGPFDESKVEVIERGRGELIPPVLVTRSSRRAKRILTNPMDELDLRLKALRSNDKGSGDELASIYLQFCNLLNRRRKREADLHAFMKRYPIALDGHHAKVYSEVTIGSYRADLVFCYEQSDKRIVLVELEMDSAPIFNKKNRPRHEVVHAAQQVEDWISAIRQNTLGLPDWLNGAYVVEGLVIVGRSTALNDHQKQALFNLNSNRLVKIITYDDLLLRLSNLIASLEHVSSGGVTSSSARN